MSLNPNLPSDAAKAAGAAAAEQAANSLADHLHNEKAGKAVQQAQQAVTAYTSAGQPTGKPAAAPLPGIKAIPFEDLDTPSATRIAMSNSRQNDTAAAAAADTSIPKKIAAKVFIGDTPIHEILSLAIIQQYGEHNTLKLRFFQDQAQAQGSFTFEGAEKLLGQVAEIELFDQNNSGSGKLQHLFVIADVQFDQEALNEGIITVTGYSPTWILDGDPHFEAFYKKDLSTISKSVCKSLEQVKGKLKSNPTLTDQLPFVCRYNESVWNFMKRLSAETGQWLYWNGSELVFGRPDNSSGPALVYGENCFHINMGLHAKPLPQGLFDYESEHHTPINSEANSYDGNAGAYNNIAFNKSKELFGSTPSYGMPRALSSRSDTLKKIARSRSAQRAAGMYTVKGESTLHELRTGMVVDISFKRQQQSASHAPMRITNIEHQLDATGIYTNSFEAIPAASEMPPDVQFIQPVTHPMLAEIIDNSDGKGRVRAKFMGWQQQDLPETDFIRVLTPDAGGGGDKVASNRGLVTVPEVGDQVYIDFEHGNPDRPFVTGSVFHGGVGTGGGGGNNVKSLTSKSGHTVTLNDGAGITVKDKADNVISLDGAGNALMETKETITIKCGESSISMDKAGNIQIKGKQIVTLGEAIGVSGKNSVGIGVGPEGGTPTSGIAIEATTLDVGTKTLTLSAETEAHLAGKTVNIGGGTETNISSGKVKLN